MLRERYKESSEKYCIVKWITIEKEKKNIVVGTAAIDAAGYELWIRNDEFGKNGLNK